MNSLSCILKHPSQPSREIVVQHPVRLFLSVPVPPSFKNRKRAIIDGKSGKPRTWTPKKTKARMNQLEESFVAALLSAYQTHIEGTSTGCSLQSWIATSTPGDDSWQVMSEILITGVKSEKPFVEMILQRI